MNGVKYKDIDKIKCCKVIIYQIVLKTKKGVSEVIKLGRIRIYG